MDAICDVYETQWTGSDVLHAQVQAIEVLWQDYSHKLGDQVLVPLNTYTGQFPEMRVNHLILLTVAMIFTNNFIIFRKKLRKEIGN